MTKSRNWLSLITMLLLAFALGCAEEPEVETTTAADLETTATSTAEVPGLPDGSQPVQVLLTSYAIEMPSTLPEGRTLFTVSNESDMEHNFEIEGQGIEKELERPLQGGEVMTLEVDLVPGEYRVYCPIEDHASQGMETTLTVTEGEPTTASDMDEAEAVEGEMGYEETPPADPQ